MVVGDVMALAELLGCSKDDLTWVAPLKGKETGLESNLKLRMGNEKVRIKNLNYEDIMGERDSFLLNISAAFVSFLISPSFDRLML